MNSTKKINTHKEIIKTNKSKIKEIINKHHCRYEITKGTNIGKICQTKK